MSALSLPKIVTPRFDTIVGLTDAVCRTHLTDEYAALARELAAALARKRPSPLMRGHCDTWACGVMYTIGAVNFLFDPAQTPSVTSRELCALFGVSQSACAAKTREIRRLFDIGPLDPRWSLPSRLAENPLVWMILVNGVMVDMRTMPCELQEQAYELGLIPFVPGAGLVRSIGDGVNPMATGGRAKQTASRSTNVAPQRRGRR